MHNAFTAISLKCMLKAEHCGLLTYFTFNWLLISKRFDEVLLLTKAKVYFLFWME